MDYTVNINGHCLEYVDESHLYVVDGILVPSVTQILKYKFGGMYAKISPSVLQNAADLGTAVHEAIEKYCKTGEESEFPEVHNFQFLMDQYHFQPVNNEVPVILFGKNGHPLAAGRLDLVLKEMDHMGLGDIKRTSALNKEYLAYQLNIYRIAYQQCYGTPIDFLRGVHLREDVRKYVEIPINEEKAWELVEEYFNE